MAEQPRIAIDLQALQSWTSQGRGIGRYVYEIATALVAGHRDSVHSLLVNPRLPVNPRIEELAESGLVREHTVHAPLDGSGLAPNVYFLPSPIEWDLPFDEVWPKWARDPRIRIAATLHDLIPLIYPDEYLVRSRMTSTYWARLELARHADALLCVSEATAVDARRLLEFPSERITVVGEGVSGAFEKPAAPRLEHGSPVPGATEVRTPYLMYTGGIDFRKNVSGMMEAFALLPESIRESRQLVIVLKATPEELRNLVSEAEAIGIADRVVFTGFVADDVLTTLYQQTELFVFPSLYEGFGLPIVEAIKSGALTIASDTSSMVDLVADPELRFDPTEPTDISRAIVEALAIPDPDGVRQRQLDHITRNFSWETSAARTVEGITRSLPDEPLTPSSDAAPFLRRRIALFSPLPPDESGIADYTWRLAPELARYVDVDLVVQDSPLHHPSPPGENVEIIPLESFTLRHVLQPYAAIIYTMGNSSFHGDIYDQMKSEPGTVLLHEARFAGFFGWYLSSHGQPSSAFHDLLRREPSDTGQDADFTGWPSYADAEKGGIYLTGPIIDRASRVLTTNEWTASVARMQRPSRAADVHNIGFGYPPVVRSEIRDGVHWLATFGHQDEIKATDLVIEAFALLAARHPEVNLAIVGYVDPGYRETLRHIVERDGLSDRVVITERVDAETYEAWLRRADIAVQLRRSTNGETSAAVGDCLRHGIPTIVTDIGGTAEIPDDVVTKIPVSASATQLADAIDSLLTESGERSKYSQNAIEFVSTHGFPAAARRMLEVLGLRA